MPNQHRPGYHVDYQRARRAADRRLREAYEDEWWRYFRDERPGWGVRPPGDLAFLYRLYDEADRLLYVGITGSPNQRFKHHAQAQPWWPDVVRHEIEEICADDALSVERDAIINLKPRHNRTHSIEFD